MKVEILQQLPGARKAQGLTVVIDVFRAFTVECYLYDFGAEEVLPVGSEETARKMKKENPDFVLVGERGGKILPGFDFGNSSAQIPPEAVKGKTIIHTTSAGTQGIVAAAGADEIITGSLVNAGAIADYIRKKQPEQVSLVCMGLAGKEETPEDTLCAEYIKSLLENEPFDMQRRLEILKTTAQGSKFFKPELQEVFPEKDFYMCTDVDRFDFVLRVENEGEFFRTCRIM